MLGVRCQVSGVRFKSAAASLSEPEINRNPIPETRYLKPETWNLEPITWNLKPWNLEPGT